MRANEFVKKRGWGEAISLIDASKICGIDKSIVDIEELKRLVESHDYIECLGGYQFVKDNLPSGYFGDGDYKDLIQKCLEDMEICK